jgi:hypothetical protein
MIYRQETHRSKTQILLHAQTCSLFYGRTDLTATGMLGPTGICDLGPTDGGS